ncbi:S-adenosylmethionine synthase isoform type-2 [Astathelohania contejeani]|uniref:S-adenosylmethionine synthase n=1 Tax=Astathelohania contejeani TaxID=164912 RepID=A0ABQ7HXZ4_9MICR|nr:S-adenosylmethionine synthase isoform type-2 [Thelohania contejeani]
MENTFLFTSESVGEGHPDKLCDQISDAILDAHLRLDNSAKVAVETMVKTGMVMVAGEVTSSANVNYAEIVRNVIKDVGYDCCSIGFDYKTANVLVGIEKQSSDIAQAIHAEQIEDMGAGDQGMMFGYATDETDEKMPLTLMLSHKLNQRLAQLRKSKELIWLRPDSKAQVTVEYMRDGGAVVPIRVDRVVLSTQHSEEVSLEEMKKVLLEKVIKFVIPSHLLKDTKYYIQPSGKFVIGGPMGDTGLTGRKIIVDTYGGFGCHGGGAFSGKDWSKVDRSGAYAARWVAKSLVCAGVCRRILIQISYAIGISEPLSLHVDTFGTSQFTDKEIIGIIHDNFDLRPGVIVKELGLDKPIYRETSVYGHFGRDNFSWEKPKELKLTPKNE